MRIIVDIFEHDNPIPLDSFNGFAWDVVDDIYNDGHYSKTFVEEIDKATYDLAGELPGSKRSIYEAPHEATITKA